MPSTLFWLIIVLMVFALLSKHILGPIAVRSRVSRPVDPGFDEIPDEHARALFPSNFSQTISELETLGFTLIGHLSSSTTERTRATLSLLVNRASKSSALVSSLASVTPGTTRPPVNYVEFITEFDDGSQIDTSNSSSVKVFYEVPQRIAVKVPHLKEVNSLYRVHSYLVGQRARQARPSCRNRAARKNICARR